MHDLFGNELELWHAVEDTVLRVFQSFGYQEIRTPVLEKVEVFSGTVGEDTDIVEKQMYLVEKEKAEKLVLRPEGTASFMRAVAEHQLHLPGQPQRYFYYLPMFRHERPQKGRLRQFHQFGAELLHQESAEADVEIIFVMHQIFVSLGFTDYEIRINSVGCPICRPAYREVLVRFLEPYRAELCANCQARLKRSPLRVLDCKVESCRKGVEKAPRLIHHLCSACAGHFSGVKELLSLSNTSFMEDSNIVRGLDYYTRTAFEFTSNRLGAQSALGAGGRYDGLADRFGLKNLPAVGFGLGMERLMLVLHDAKCLPALPSLPSVYFAPLGNAAVKRLFPLSLLMKKAGIRVEINYERDKGLKWLLKQANRLNAQFALIVGDKEINQNSAILKDLTKGSQEILSWSGIETELQRRMKSEA